MLTAFDLPCFKQLELTLYDPKDSFTGELVTCSQDFCAEINGGAVTGCKANASCLYTETYGDGSYSIGYFVMDIVQYASVSGDLETKLANGSVIFGYAFISIIDVCSLSVKCYISLFLF